MRLHLSHSDGAAKSASHTRATSSASAAVASNGPAAAPSASTGRGGARPSPEPSCSLRGRRTGPLVDLSALARARWRYRGAADWIERRVAGLSDGEWERRKHRQQPSGCREARHAWRVPRGVPEPRCQAVIKGELCLAEVRLLAEKCRRPSASCRSLPPASLDHPKAQAAPTHAPRRRLGSAEARRGLSSPPRAAPETRPLRDVLPRR